METLIHRQDYSSYLFIYLHYLNVKKISERIKLKLSYQDVSIEQEHTV